MSAAVVERDSLGTESTHVSRAARTVWAILAVFAVALVASIVAAPLAQSQGHPQFAGAIYKAYRFVCHQFSDRSFHLAGHQFAVCSRCTGLYSGFAVAVLAYPLLRSLRSTESPPRLWLILAAVPLAVDFALGYFSIWQNNHLSRFSTGALLGAAAVFYIMPGLVDLTSRFGRRRLRTSQIT